MTTDERLHYLGGYLKALPWRCEREAKRAARVLEIDLFGFYREWKQNLAGQNPNIPMGTHQLYEARAWGQGARAALGVDPQRPVEYMLGKPPPIQI